MKGNNKMKDRICNRCIMTEKADPEIIFDSQGNCNYCNEALASMDRVYFPNEKGKEMLNKLVEDLKKKNYDKGYDCLMGISGGLDSCYLAYLGAVKWGLRIAAIHIDDGFDTEICKNNIERLCEKSNIDIKYIKPDEKQYYRLCKAYIKAGVPNLAVPQDNVLFSCIYNYAQEEGISDFLSGSNYALECILQKGNTIEAYDLVNIRDINRRFGTDEIDKLPVLSKWSKNYIKLSGKVVTWTPLNYIDYNRERALKELKEFCGFEYYGSKHLENYYTGFLQLYWLPQKFDVDKRTSHLSSMIISGQMTRDDALKEIKKASSTEEWLDKAVKMVKEKLSISDEEFADIMNAAPHQHNEFKTDKLFDLLIKVKRMVVK